MADFKEAYKKTMGHEGYYSNDPDDLGGETWKGIARRFHPKWSGWKIIDAYKNEPNFPNSIKDNYELEEKVKEFYKTVFWDELLGDQIPSQYIGEEMFDTAVNTGVERAVKFLQTALNVLNRHEKLYNNLNVDGAAGHNTLKALKALLAIKGEEMVLYKVLNILQGYHYVTITLKSESQERFMRGWLKRVDFIKD
jgi:lysozyme family protein